MAPSDSLSHTDSYIWIWENRIHNLKLGHQIGNLVPFMNILIVNKNGLARNWYPNS